MASANIPFDRTVLLASADASLRQRLRNSLSGLRWDVREARGGAEAIAQLEGRPTEALLLDHWLPDLEVMELAEQIGALYPEMELLRIDGDPIAGGSRSPRRHELLHAVRESLGAQRRREPRGARLEHARFCITPCAHGKAGEPRAGAPAQHGLRRQPPPPCRSAGSLATAPSCWSWRATCVWWRRVPRPC